LGDGCLRRAIFKPPWGFETTELVDCVEIKPGATLERMAKWKAQTDSMVLKLL